MEGLPIGRFHGVGPATEAKMLRLGIANGLDPRERSLPFLQQHFGKAGAYYFGIAKGIDHRPVRANRIRKSVGAENTFADDLVDYEPMREALQPFLDKVWQYCEANGTRGRTVTLKVKFSDFTIITRSKSVAATIAGRDALETISLALLQAEMPMRRTSGARRQPVVADGADGRTTADDVRCLTTREKIMKVAADLCIVPMGVGPSVSRYVREIKAIGEASGLSATMHANGTSIEGKLIDICGELGAAFADMGVQRTFFTLIFSTGRDKDQTLADKMAAVS